LVRCSDKGKLQLTFRSIARAENQDLSAQQVSVAACGRVSQLCLRPWQCTLHAQWGECWLRMNGRHKGAVLAGRARVRWRREE
jgi:hypothetical protein